MNLKSLILNFLTGVMLSVCAIFLLRTLHGNADAFADLTTCVVVNVAVGLAMMMGQFFGWAAHRS